MAEVEDTPWECGKCGAVMTRVSLPRYEYEEGYTLHNVPAYRCPQGHNVFFTEEQAHEMERRTDELKKYTFGFERKVTVSGRSLVLAIPSELAEHLRLKKGQKVRLFPIAREGLMVRAV